MKFLRAIKGKTKRDRVQKANIKNDLKLDSKWDNTEKMNL